MLANIDPRDQRVRRYAPVAALAVALLLALVVPSKTNRLVSGTIEATAAPATSTASPSTTVTAPPTTIVASLTATDAALAPPVVRPKPGLSASESSVSAAPVTPTTAMAVASPPVTTAPLLTGPLVVTKHTWAQSSTRRGTPLETAADGQLPIAAFAGSNDRASYVELDGSEAVLRLAVYTGDDSGDSLPESAAISACPIISAGWERQDAQSFASAPAYDEAKCVAGERAADGSAWLFDLAGFANRADSAGFALVPTAGGGGTWHVTLSPG